MTRRAAIKITAPSGTGTDIARAIRADGRVQGEIATTISADGDVIECETDDSDLVTRATFQVSTDAKVSVRYLE